MTLYISHRGNISGPKPEKENHPDYLKAAITKGYNVELDVWYKDNKIILGHDKPQYEVDKKFLVNPKFWCHAKSIETISVLMESSYLIHSFFHDKDSCTLTSKGWIWTYPGQLIVSQKAIAVMPENIFNWDFRKAGGICSDYIEDYKI